MADPQILQLFGLAFFLVGLGALISPRFYNSVLDRFLDSPAIIAIASVIALAIGFLLVVYHNFWELNWGLIITVAGYLALIEGAFMLLLPRQYVKLSHWFRRKMPDLTWQSTLVMLGGAFLLYLGAFVY